MAQIYFDYPIEFTNIEDIKRYKPKQFISFTCEQCGCITKKYRSNIKVPLLCTKCIKINSAKGKDWSERNRKLQATKLERYGNAFYVNPDLISSKLKNKSEEEKQKIKEKVAKTNNERYGMHPACRDEQKDRTKATCIKKYGAVSPAINEDIKKKIENTCIEKYGVTNVFGNKDIIEKIKETNLLKYGYPNPRSSKTVDEKIKITCIEKYGVEHPWSNHDVRIKCQQNYTYDGINFDSSWELYYYIYLSEHNIDFTYQPDMYITYSENKRYYPDFIVEGKMIEIKGEQFFEDGKMINPYDRAQDNIYEEKHQCMIENGVTILRKKDMENIFNYVDNKYTNDYVLLFKNNIDFPYVNNDFRDKSDDGIIRHFHKSIYHSNRDKCLSPFDAWANKGLVKKSALNRLKYVGKCSPSDIIQGFNITKIAPKVSVFKVGIAEKLINKYLNQFSTIFDPFSGFSGRLIGAYRSNKKYIGSDIEDIHVKESNYIIDYFGISNTCNVEVKNIFDYKGYECECLFTCPPYGGIEHWGEISDKSGFRTCDEWIEICIEHIKAKRYLFVVDKTEKYKEYIVETFENKSHFGKNEEYVILIDYEC